MCSNSTVAASKLHSKTTQNSFKALPVPTSSINTDIVPKVRKILFRCCRKR